MGYLTFGPVQHWETTGADKVLLVTSPANFWTQRFRRPTSPKSGPIGEALPGTIIKGAIAPSRFRPPSKKWGTLIPFPQSLLSSSQYLILPNSTVIKLTWPHHPFPRFLPCLAYQDYLSSNNFIRTNSGSGRPTNSKPPEYGTSFNPIKFNFPRFGPSFHAQS